MASKCILISVAAGDVFASQTKPEQINQQNETKMATRKPFPTISIASAVNYSLLYLNISDVSL